MHKHAYYTVLLDVGKFRRWLETRKRNGAHISCARVACEMGYGRSYISQLLQQDKYSIEVSGRFIGSFLHTFGLQFEEIFRIVPADDDADIEKYSGTYIKQKVWKRYQPDRLPHTWESR